MYAIVDDGGRQMKVHKGEVVRIDNAGLTPGEEITLGKVVFYSDENGDVRVGKPALSDVTVKAIVQPAVKGPKLVVQHFRRRKNSRKRVGHRQAYGQVRIQDITVS